jgi:serine phosphatase RsbU (regulator of sigma subunit)
MDIAFCSINKGNLIVSYSGANRPLWYIRKGQNELEEIIATKKAIGGLTDDDQEFQSHEIQFLKGDTFYLCSDGYADQFGGQSGKKLMTKKLKEILLAIHGNSMQEQEKLLDNFIETWKAGTEQIDDILVIGVRL